MTHLEEESVVARQHVNDAVLAKAPHNTRGQRAVRNANDDIFGSAGPGPTLDLQSARSGSGYAATLTIGLQMG